MNVTELEAAAEPGTDDLVGPKVAVLVVTAVITLFGSALPWIARRCMASTKRFMASLGYMIACAAGVVFGGYMCHIAPESAENMATYFATVFEEGSAYIAYPYSQVLTALVFMLLVAVENAIDPHKALPPGAHGGQEDGDCDGPAAAGGHSHAHAHAHGHAHGFGFATETHSEHEHHVEQEEAAAAAATPSAGISGGAATTATAAGVGAPATTPAAASTSADSQAQSEFATRIVIPDGGVVMPTAGELRNALISDAPVPAIGEVDTVSAASADATPGPAVVTISSSTEAAANNQSNNTAMPAQVHVNADHASEAGDSHLSDLHQHLHPHSHGLHGHGHGSKGELDAFGAQQSRVLRAYVFFAAMSIHAILDGLSVGTETDSASFTALAIAVVAHKLFDGLAVGVPVFLAGFSTFHTLAMVLIPGLMTPLGIGISMIIHTVTEGDSNVLASGILESLSGGTFLYIALFELLPASLRDGEGNMWKVLLFLLGFAAMAIIAIWA